MSVDTRAKIRGYVNHEDIIKYIRENWDNNASTNIRKNVVMPLTKCEWAYKINEHSDDPENWYGIWGIIYFTYKGEERMLAYNYNNINSFGNLERYSKLGLAEMIQSETTELSLGHWGSSVEILKTLTEHFGGGWLDEDDCDDDYYYPVEAKKCEKEENKLETVEEKIKHLEDMLFKAIVGWYDNSKEQYKSLDDKEFVKKVCETTGLSEADYYRILFVLK